MYYTFHNPEPPSSTRLVAMVILSVAVHALLILVRPSETPPAVSSGEIPIEIAELPLPPPPVAAEEVRRKSPKSTAKEAVKTEDAGNDEIDPNAQFLSDRNQKAEVQSKARRAGEFREGGDSLPEGELSRGEKGGGPKPVDVADRGEELPSSRKGKKDWKTLSLKDLGLGGTGTSMASDQDYLRDVAEGNRTVLSTRETKYFSYYYRIKELLQQYWRPSVQRRLAKVWGSGRVIREDELVTKVLVLLNPKGELQKVTRVASSGFDEVDGAAIEAFQRAAPFPNPPSGIVEADGLIRVYWDFILKLEAAPVIQFSGAGSPPPPP